MWYFKVRHHLGMNNKTIKQHLAVIGLYVGFALVMSLPVLLSFGVDLAGNGGDPWQVLWRFDDRIDAVRQDISDGGIGSAIVSEFGGGEPRLVNLSVWPWMWVHLLFGEPIAYNIIWLCSFVLSGYGMFLLVNYLFKRHGEEDFSDESNIILKLAPAFIAGLVYMLLPFHVAHSFGHFGAMQTQWIPLIILTLYMLMEKLTVVRAVMFMLLVTIQAWTEHHYMLWLGVFMVWLLFYSVGIGKKWKGSKRTLLYMVLVGAVFIFTVVIPYWPTIQLAVQPNSVIELRDEQLVRFSADPLAYVVPAPFHTLWGWLSNNLFGQHFTGNVQESTLYLGLVPALLILFYHQKIPKKQKKFWLWTVIIFWIISLGPKLHIMGYVTRIPMPYGLIDNLPIMSVVRTVVRAAVLVNVGWVVLLAWVLKTQLKRTSSVIVVVMFVLVEFLFWPMPTMSWQTPLVYEQIKDMGGEAVIEIPAATNYLVASRALYGSRVHNKELINNIALERASGAEAYQEVRSMPALRQLLYLRTDHIIEGREEFLRQDMVETLFDVTKWLNAQQIIVHQDSLSNKQRDAVIDLLEKRAGLKRTEVEDTWLYEVTDNNQGDGVFIARDDGWKKVALNEEKNEVSAEIESKAGFTIYNVNKEASVVRLIWAAGEEDNNSLDISTDTKVIEDSGMVDGVRTVTILVEPGKTAVDFVNNKDGVLKIFEPVMKVLGTAQNL